MAEVSFGWLIRSIHSWSANLMILTLFIHMASVYLTRAYRRPREATWISGVGLLVVVLGFGFSGYLLPWNKLAFFATQVGTQIVGSVPLAGSFLLRFLRGGDNVTGATITRFYAFHVAILPATATALLGLHVLLVHVHGMSTPPSYQAGPCIRLVKPAWMGIAALLVGHDAIGIPRHACVCVHITRDSSRRTVQERYP